MRTRRFPPPLFIPLFLLLFSFMGLSEGRPGPSVEPRQVPRLFCAGVSINDTLAWLNDSVTQLFVFFRFFSPRRFFSTEILNLRLQGPRRSNGADNSQRGGAGLSRQELRLCFAGAAVSGSRVCPDRR